MNQLSLAKVSIHSKRKQQTPEKVIAVMFFFFAKSSINRHAIVVLYLYSIIKLSPQTRDDFISVCRVVDAIDAEHHNEQGNGI
jgi:hypothetical protein